MPIECGSPFSEKRYWLLLALFFLGFAAYFTYDGTLGYPRKNMQEAEKTYKDAAVRDAIATRESPNEDDTRAVTKNRPPSVRAVRDLFGEPTQTSQTSTGETVNEWASRYGRLTVSSVGEAVSSVAWNKWYKDRSEIRAQLYIAAGIFVITLMPLWRLLGALTLRVRVDEKELRYGGRTIPLAEITELRDPKLKGRIDVVYGATGTERTLRLDNLKVAAFNEIIGFISTQRGLPNPLQSAAPVPEEKSA